jgi:chemotaxis-related protein WspD
MNPPPQMASADKVRRLLDLAPPAEFQKEWTEFYAAEKQLAPRVKHSLVIFRLGDEWLALDTKAFQEIAGRSPVHTVPHRKKGIVAGLTRVRGELLICVSLAAILGITCNASADAAKASERFIVLNGAGGRFVFVADEVHGIHRLAEELSPPPVTVAHAGIRFTRGIFAWQNKTVGCLDDQVLFQAVNQNLA